MDGESKTLVVFDLDETITTIDTYPALLIRALWLRPWRVFPALSLPISLLLHKFGFMHNTRLKQLAFRAILTGLDQIQMTKLCSDFANHVLSKRLRPCAKGMIEFHQQRQHRLVLATASFDLYVELMAKKLGFNTVLCTSASWTDNIADGQEHLSNCYGEEKARRVAELKEQLGFESLVAYSDSSADLPLLRLSNHPVAVNASRKLKKTARQNNWQIQDWQDTSKLPEYQSQLLH